jgi:uncharacterized protein YdhG (YjbR/CyaY superfamily)
MTSKAATVAEWMEEVPEERREALKKLRALCRRILKGYKEEMPYGMPAYLREGAGGFGFNSQKQYISLYFEVHVLDEFRSELAGASCGKCCVRYTKPEKIDFALVERMLRRTTEVGSGYC